MIPVDFRRGLHLPEPDLWLDPRDARAAAFVSHAHADHFARHERAICSQPTSGILRARFGMAAKRLDARDWDRAFEFRGHRLRLLPAGHVSGSAMLHVTRLHDGASLLYTGDFKLRPGRTAEAAALDRADQLILETTFGLPRFVFPPTGETEERIVHFVRAALADGDVPVLLGYSLGKAQEALALVHAHGIPAVLHPKVAEMTRVCRRVGVSGLPEPRVLEKEVPVGHAVIAPPNTVRSKLLRGIKNRRLAMLSGWALTPGARYRYQVEEVFPLSDHADHPGLLEAVRRVAPRRVLTVHGFTAEFAGELRQLGYEAWTGVGRDQLELALGGPSVAAAGEADGAARPGGEFAGFTDLCHALAARAGRVEKTELLADYLRRAPDLALAATWLGGRALARRHGALRVGSATLRHALFKVPGVRQARYREISRTQNDAARTARLVLEEAEVEPRAADFADIDAAFRDLARAGGSLARVRRIAERLATLHPAEGETFVKILTGDLRIGLAEGLLEDALARALDRDPAALRRAHMLTGDLGETAVMARDDTLSRATLRPFTPLKVMLASAETDAESLHRRHGEAAGARLWLEAKHDGIRAQLHKSGDAARLFSRDLRDLDAQFPELLEAARRLPGEFILDGEIIAFADGRQLNFFDLQRRLGRLNTRQPDLFAGTDTPVRFIAFDRLLSGAETLLDRPLSERRAALEALFRDPATPACFTAIEVVRSASIGETAAAFKRARAAGCEGLISKDPASPYRPGRRGKSWLKLKGVMPTLDCVVVAAEQGHGKRADVLSDYTFAVRDPADGSLRTLGKAYSGLTDAEIEELTEHFRAHTLETTRRKHHVEPLVVLEIAFDSVRPSKRHDSGFALRFPRIKAIRRDKEPGDIDTLDAVRALGRASASPAKS